MRNYDLGLYQAKQVELKRVLQRQYTKNKLKIGRTIEKIRNQIDWKLLLRIIILAILAFGVALGLTVKAIADQRLEETRSKLHQTEQELEKVKQENQQNLEELKKQQQDLKKEIEDAKKLISQHNERKRLAQLAQVRVASAYVFVGSGSCADEIRKYDWPHYLAHQIMLGESGGNPGNVNNNPRTGDYSVGCFQINLFGANRYSRPSEGWLKVASNNVSYAYNLYVSQGRTFCTTGGWINTCRKLGWI